MTTWTRNRLHLLFRLKRPPWRSAHVGALALYFLLTCYLLLPVLPFFDSVIPGSGLANADGWQNVWNLWWVRYALTHWQNPFYTPMIFHPDGAELYLQHALNIANGLLTLPVQLLAGPVAAYNTAVVLGFVLSGYATYLLALHLIRHAGIALVVGAIFTFSPFHLARLWDGHLSWVTLQWIPFYLWALIQAWDEQPLPQQRRYWMALLAGIFLTLAALNTWYHALYCLIFTMVFLLVRLAFNRQPVVWRQTMVTLGIIAGVSGVLLAPVLLPTLTLYSQQGSDSGWDRLTIAHSADIIDFVTPSHLHPLWGQAAAEWHNQMRPGIWGWVITPGIAVLLLAAIGVWAFWQQTRLWLVVVLIISVLAFGPRLVLAGFATDIPMPYAFLQWLPGMSMARRPNHLILVILPLVAVLAGFGLYALLLRGCLGEMLLLLFGILVLLEYLVLPFPRLPLFVHPSFAELREQPGAVFELPLEHRSAGPMVNQMVHERPIVGGYLSRSPDIPAFVQRVPWVNQLWQAQPYQGIDIFGEAPDDAWQAFSFYDLRTIVIWNNRLHRDQVATMQMLMERFLPELHIEQPGPEMTIYQVAPVPTPHPFLFAGTGWYQREYAQERIWRWMAETATVQLVNPSVQTTVVGLEIDVESYQHTRPLALTLDETPLDTFAIPRAARTLRLWLALSPGEHTLRFQSEPSMSTAGTPRLLSLSFTRIAIRL
ncbi:MAG: hypothetical protein HC837_04890 [Chloroflexaceae bacterium]|nr:hypothetical protein [Chloroflexaceae bacterium]